MHTDEAVNAYIVGQLLAGETFTYDPQDRHGPALAAFALPLARLQGAKAFSDLTESELRLTTVLAGTVTILLFGAAVEMFGFVPCLIAALLFAMRSSARLLRPVFHSRVAFCRRHIWIDPEPAGAHAQGAPRCRQRWLRHALH